MSVLQGLLDSTDFSWLLPEVLVVFDGVDYAAFQRDFFASIPVSLRRCFRFLRTEKKVFSGGARSLGLDHARGSVIAFLGDDTVPESTWLSRVFDFHQKYPEEDMGLLGHVAWTDVLAEDPFHQWLLCHAQFDFQSVARDGADWRHFYTSNISLKRSLVGDLRFSSAFQGWGFEDIEFGYRLFQKGLRLIYQKDCVVFHDHPQNLDSVLRQTRNARENALVFERLHPEVSLLPRGGRAFVLRGILFLLVLFPARFFPRLAWWRAWKRAWLGLNSLEK
jgi:hypothetical protein